MAVRLWTWIYVPLRALFGVLALCTWLYSSGRGSTCLYRLFSVCWPGARGCTPRDVDPRAAIGSLRCVGPVHGAVLVWTWIHVTLPAILGELALDTWLSDFGHVSTRLYRLFSVCWPSARCRRPLDVDPRGSTGSFRCVGSVYVAVRLWSWIHVSLPVLFDVLVLCTWLDSSGP